MSQNELNTTKTVLSFQLTALAGTGGLLLDALLPNNFYYGISRIIALQLVTAIGAGAGSAKIVNLKAPTTAGAVGVPQQSLISVVSSVNTDLSVYRVVWVNEFLSNNSTGYNNLP